jgi:hypothetical protein
MADARAAAPDVAPARIVNLRYSNIKEFFFCFPT